MTLARYNPDSEYGFCLDAQGEFYRVEDVDRVIANLHTVCSGYEGKIRALMDEGAALTDAANEREGAK